jgi:hypothetical protein
MKFITKYLGNYMKLLFLLLVFMAPTLAKASCNNEIPLSFAQEIIAAQDYTQLTPKQCKDFPQEECLCFQGLNLAAIEIVDEIIDGAPIYTVNSQVGCTDELDCLAKQQALVCDEGFTSAYRLDTPQAYCYRLDGYEPFSTGKKKLQHNSTKLAQVQAKLSAEATLLAVEKAGIKAKADCDRVLNLIRGFNLQPGRTSEQTDAMSSAFSEIKNALADGRPGKAKALIQAATPDGVVVTQGMKDAALSLLKDW